MLTVFLVVGLCALREFGAEAAVKILIQDATVETLDPEFYDPGASFMNVVKDPTTGENVINYMLTYIKKVPDDVDVFFNLTGMANGEYTGDVVMEMKLGLCDGLDEPLYVAPIMAEAGITREACPPEPGVYKGEGFTFSGENFPDDFPKNNYLGYIEVSLNGKRYSAFKHYLKFEAKK